MRKVIMLDFDGVLHPAQGSRVADFAWAPRLAEVLERYTCDVVISSTWREHYPLARLRALLPEPIAERVIGVLGEDERGPAVRYRTIQAWIASHAPDADWRAVDDMAPEFPADCPQLILCDGQIGFATEQAKLLENWLANASGAEGG